MQRIMQNTTHNAKQKMLEIRPEDALVLLVKLVKCACTDHFTRIADSARTAHW